MTRACRDCHHARLPDIGNDRKGIDRRIVQNRLLPESCIWPGVICLKHTLPMPPHWTCKDWELHQEETP